MSTTLAMVRLANRDPSTQVGNSVQLSAGYSFPDPKQSSGGRNSPCIRLLIVVMGHVPTILSGETVSSLMR